MTTNGHATDTDQPANDDKAVAFRVSEVVVDVIEELEEIDVTQSATT